MRPTFAPLERDLRDRFDWLTFVYPKLSPAGEKQVKELEKDSISAGVLADFTDVFVRRRLLQGAHHDSVVVTALGSALVMDTVHRRVAAHQILAGAVRHVPAAVSLRTLRPDVGRLTWEDIDKLRAVPGWTRLREIWDEVGQFALENAASGNELERLIRDGWEDLLAEAAESAEGPFTKHDWLRNIGSLAISVGTNYVPASPMSWQAPPGWPALQSWPSKLQHDAEVLGSLLTVPL